MKDFKFAHIVPVSHLCDIADNHYHMCLAHLVLQNTQYANFYRTMSQQGKFVMMDNGAAENAQLDTSTLLKMYEYISPTEIVIPDTLCDKDSTLAKAEEFMEKNFNLPYRFMAVPQGRTIEEWRICAYELLHRYPQIDTIGVSKFLTIATGDCYIRLKASQYILELKERLQLSTDVHLLGCHEGPAIVREIHQKVPIVRGCDSALAYIAAQARIKINADTARPSGDIDFLNGPHIKCLSQTMRQLESVACANNHANGSSWYESN